MKVKVINSSSKKTREKIKEAFALLLKEKQSLNKISVTEIAKEADITRSAFYTHYDNIYDVAKELQHETLDVLTSSLENLKSMEDLNNYFDNIFNYIKMHESLYSMILSSNEPLIFTDTLGNIISKNIFSILENTPHNDNLKLKISFFIDGFISLIIKYFHKELKCSLNDLNTLMKETFVLLFKN